MSDNPYKSFIDGNASMDAIRQANRVKSVSDVDPEKASDALRLGEKYELPGPISPEIADELREREQSEGLISAVKSQPGLGKWLENPTNSSIAHDDVEPLASVSDKVKRRAHAEKMAAKERSKSREKHGYLQWALFGKGGPGEEIVDFLTDTPRAAAAGAGKGAGSSVSGAGRLYRMLDQTLQDLVFGAVRTVGGDDAEAAVKDAVTIPHYIDPGAALLRQGGDMKEASERFDVPIEDRTFGTDVAGAVGQMGFQIAAFYLTGGVGGTGTLMSQGTDIQADQLLAEDVELSSPEARAAMAVGGPITAITERIGLDRVLKLVPDAIKSKVSGLLWNAFKAGGTEAVTEAAEGIMQNTVTYLAAGVDESLPQYILSGAGYDAAVGGTAGAAVNVLLNLMLPGRRAVLQSAAEQARKEVQEMYEAAKQSALRERSPEKFREAVRAMQGDDAGTVVYVPADAFAELYQEGDQTPEDVAAAMGIDPTEYQQSAASGARMAIPIESYLAHVDDAAHAALADHITFEADGMSLADLASGEVELQVEELRAQTEAKIRQIEEAGGEGADIVAQAREIAEASGLPSSEAEPLSVLMGAMINTMSRRTGMSATEFASAIGGLPSFNMEPVDVTQALDTEEFDALLERARSVPQQDTDVQVEGEAEVPPGDAAVIEYLDNLGIDFREMSNQEVRIRVEELQAQQRASEDGAELDQSATRLRKGDETLKRFGLDPEKKHKTRDVAAALEKRTRKATGGIDPTDRSEQAEQKIARWLAEEVRFEMRPGNEQNSGVGWYSWKFQNALDNLGAIHPELIDDGAAAGSRFETRQNARDFMTAMIAITSDGMKVYENFRLAEAAFHDFKETGAVDPVKLKRNRSAFAGGLEAYLGLVDAMGIQGAKDYLLQERTVSQLKKVAQADGLDVTIKMPADAVMPLSAIVLGPKVGSFYANLSGAHGYLTMDRWWSRTINRYRGTLLSKPNDVGLERVRELVAADKRLDQLPDDDALMQYVIDYRNQYAAKGWKNGTEIEKAANTIYKDAFENLNDTPFNTSDRGLMIRAAQRAVRNLKRSGIDITVADLQAVIWYYEKRLYGELGARQTADISYEEVSKRVAEERTEQGGRRDGPALGADGGDAAGPEDGVGSEIGGGAAADTEELYQPAAEAGEGGLPGRGELGRSVGRLETAYKASGGRDLEGLPSRVWVPGHGDVDFHGFGDAQAVAESYALNAGIDYRPPTTYARVNRERAERIAQAFAEMEHNPNDPEVKASYDAMISETIDQFKWIVENTGLTVDFISTGMADPYAASPRLAIVDVVVNNHMWVYPTRTGFGSNDQFDPVDNPLLAETDVVINGQRALANDLFRVVHDYFGHIKEGVGFRAGGEENAWRAHSAMYSDLARRAMTTETRGQNSWVNYGPHGAANRTALAEDTVFADQKIGLLPEWAAYEGAGDVSENTAVDTGRGDGPGVRRPRPARRADGRVELTHWGSKRGLDALSPEHAFTTRTGRQGVDAERAKKTEGIWVDRTYYGLNVGRDDGYQKELGLGPVRYTASIDPESLYDLEDDPADIQAQVAQNYAGADEAEITSRYELAIKTSGYAGYWVNHEKLGMVAAVFDPLPTESEFDEASAEARALSRAKSVASIELKERGVTDTRRRSALADLVVERAGPDLDAGRAEIEAMELFQDGFSSNGERPEYRPDVNAAVEVWRDNPGEKWAAGKRRDMAERYDPTRNPVPYSSVSASARVFLPVSELRKVPGARGERRVPGDYQFDNLDASVRGEGFKMSSPILVQVNHLGDPYIVEGNTRVAVAYLNDVGSIPVEVQWLAGSETLAQGLWTPEGIKSSGVQMVAGDPRTPDQAASEKPTDTPEFKAWFGDSKVVDDNGDPLVVYHGTVRSFGEFSNGAKPRHYPMPGFYFTPEPGVADDFTRGADKRSRRGRGANIIPVYLSLQNPKFIDAGGKLAGMGRKQVEDARSEGHDGVVIKNWPDGSGDVQYVVFSPGQIKSVHNRGTFDATNPSILHQAVSEKPRGSIVLPKGGIAKGRTVINLFSGRDLSTSLHELSHYFLEVLRVSAGLPNASPETVQMWTDTKKALGIEGLQDGENIPRAAHEAFAENGERYFGDGKAPSVQLQSSFERFRAWMLQVWAYAKRVLGDKVKTDVDPELRAVLDRMLATDEEIAEQARVNSTERAFDSEQSVGMSPDEWAAYVSQDDKARAEASSRAQAAVVGEWERRKSKLQRTARKSALEEARQIVAEDPLVQAVEVLTNGRRIGADNDNETSDIYGLKIDRQSIIDLGFEANINTQSNAAAGNDLFPRGKGVIYSETDGVSPEAAAAVFGYDTGRELLDDLLRAPKASVAIEAEADRIMKERFGDLLNDGSVTLEIIEGMHQKERGKLLAMELNAIYRRAPVSAINQKAPDRKIIREVARRMMVDMSLEKAKREDLFLAAERRAARDTMRHLAKGDFIAAREAKQRQLINFYLYAESHKLRKEIVKDERLIKSIVRGEDKSGKGRDIDYVRAARVVLSRFGLASEPRGYSFSDWVEDLRQSDPQLLDEIGRAVAVATAAAKPAKELSLSEYRGMMDAVRSLMEAAKSRRTAELNGQKVDIDDAREMILNQLDKVYEKSYLERRGEGLAAGMRDFMLSMSAALRRVQAWSRYADGGDDNGTVTNLIVRPVLAGIDRYRDKKEATLKRALEILKPTMGDAHKGGSIKADELGGHIFRNKGEIIAAILNTGNESNAEALMKGYSWNPAAWDAFIERMTIEGVITKRDFDTVQSIWDLFEGLRPGAQAAHRKIYGHYFDRIPARPLQTPFGIYRGGYVPLSYDKSLSAIGQNVDANRLFDEQQSSAMFPTTGKGFTIKRSKNVSAPVDLSLRMIPSHIDKVLRFTYIQPEVRTVARVLSGHDFKQRMFEMDPKMLHGMLLPWLQRSASQQVESRSLDGSVGWFDGPARFARRSAGATTMVLNYVNALQQFTGFFPALTRVRSSSIARGMATYYMSPGKTTQFVYSRSPFMRRRVGVDAQEAMTDLQHLLSKPSMMKSLQDFSFNAGYVLQRVADRLVAQPIWLAAYNEATERGDNEGDAVAFADGVVRDTQSSFNAEDVSAVEVGSPLKRIFTMFLNYFNAQYNLLATEAGTAVKDRGLVRSLPRTAAVYMAVVAMPAVLAEIIGVAFRGGFEDEDDDGYADDSIMFVVDAQVRYLLAMIPFLGQAANAIWGAFDDKTYNDRVSLSPVTMVPEKIGQAGKAIQKQIEDGDNEARTVKDTLTAIMMLLGIGGGNAIGKAAGYGTGVATGEYRPRSIHDIVKGVSTGREID